MWNSLTAYISKQENFYTMSTCLLVFRCNALFLCLLFTYDAISGSTELDKTILTLIHMKLENGNIKTKYITSYH